MYLNNICRTCSAASTANDLQSLFANDDSYTIADMLAEIVDIKIQQNDVYPQYICLDCLEKLTAAYNFKKQCLDTHLKFDENFRQFDDIKFETDSNDFAGAKQENLFLIHLENQSSEECEDRQIKEEIVSEPISKKPYKTKCKICNKTITKIHEHMRSHTKEKPYKCEFCGMDFSIRSNCIRHLRIHKNERPHVCHICNKRFTVRYALVSHMSTHDRALPHKCELCVKSFKTEERLKAHALNVHYKQDADKKELDDDDSGDKSYLCNHCGKVFLRKVYLQQHLRIHTGEKPYACKLCPKTFRCKATLNHHVTIHTGERPYACQVCNQTFRQLSHLNQHKWRHTGVKPYTCALCNKQFTSSGSLIVHIRIHTGETPYVCPVCNKGFHDSSSMQKHRRRHLLSGASSDQVFTEAESTVN